MTAASRAGWGAAPSVVALAFARTTTRWARTGHHKEVPS
jgi:hypothetical protein